jgi:signal transduction histidine kinase
MIGSVVASGEPLLKAVVEPLELASATLPEYRILLEKVQVSSLLLVPLRSRGRCTGAISLSRIADAVAYDEQDLALAQELADRAALAIENALSFDELRRRVLDTQEGEPKPEDDPNLESHQGPDQAAIRLRSELLGNLAHQLRTPLNAVIGFAALLSAEKAGPLSDTQKEYLGDILTSSRHLLQLVNSALESAKDEPGARRTSEEVEP